MTTKCVIVAIVAAASVFIVATRSEWSNRCTSDADCEPIAGSTCEDDECRCADLHVISGDLTSCIPVSAGVEHECVEDRQCTWALRNGGKCVDGVCACKRGYHYVDGGCHATRRLGDACRESVECFDGFDVGSMACVAGVCACSDDYYARDGVDCRKKGTAPKSACVIDLDCKFTRAYCTSDLVCKRKLIGEFDDDDDEATRLPPETVCRIDTCAATPEPSVASSGVGSGCDADADCETEDSECFVGRCVCRRGFFHDENGGRCVYELGAVADDVGKCTVRHGEVRDGKCLCRVGFGYERALNGCIKPARGLNHSCLVDENCYTFGPSAVCVAKKCRCDGGAWFDDEFMLCRVQKGIGEACVKDSECHRETETNRTSPGCLDGVCACRGGYHEVEGLDTCQPDSVPLGETCFDTKECLHDVPHSLCDDNVCTCETGYFEMDSKCAKGVGAPCDDDDDCVADFSACAGGACACVDDYVDIESVCYERVHRLNDTCTIDAQCHLALNDPGTECVDGKCGCVPGFHSRNGDCWPKRLLGDVCAFDGECFVTTEHDSVQCRNGVCQCDYGRSAGDDRQSCPSGAASPMVSTAYLSVLFVMLYRLI